MSANPIPISETVEACQEPLLERLTRERLPLAETLGYATRVATCLRDLHAQGLIYGAVSSQLILIGPAGAELRNSGSLARLGDGGQDVTAFGRVLAEMLRRTDGPADLLHQLHELAAQCQQEAPDMQRVLIAIRLVAFRTRLATAPVRRPVLVAPPVETAPKPPAAKARIRLHLSLNWRPLVALAAFAVRGME